MSVLALRTLPFGIYVLQSDFGNSQFSLVQSLISLQALRDGHYLFQQSNNTSKNCGGSALVASTALRRDAAGSAVMMGASVL